MMKKISLLLAVVLLLTAAPSIRAGASDFVPEGYTLDCQAAIVVNTDTGRVVFEKNADERRSIASMTKIMTAVVVLERCGDLRQAVTARQEPLSAVAGKGLSLSNLKAGETMSVENLLYCLLVYSAADAATVLADEIAGSVDAFVGMMNAKAAELGLKDTHFADPHGLSNLSDGNYSTAREMEKLCEYAMKNEVFAKIVATDRYTVPATNLSGERSLTSSNRLLLEGDPCRYDKAIGIKPGYTNDAGRCLAAAATDGSAAYISIVMGCKIWQSNGEAAVERFRDTVFLLENAFGEYSLTTVLSGSQAVTTVQVDGVDVPLVPRGDILWLLGKNETVSLQTALTQESVAGPVNRGDKLGECKILIDGTEIGSADLIAAEAVSGSVTEPEETGTPVPAKNETGAASAGRGNAIITVAVILAAALCAVAAVIIIKKKKRA